jgi:hypothetical protein
MKLIKILGLNQRPPVASGRFKGSSSNHQGYWWSLILEKVQPEAWQLERTTPF